MEWWGITEKKFSFFYFCHGWRYKSEICFYMIPPYKYKNYKLYLCNFYGWRLAEDGFSNFLRYFCNQKWTICIYTLIFRRHRYAAGLGCPMPESSAHVIQNCFVWHDSVVRLLANYFVWLAYGVFIPYGM